MCDPSNCLGDLAVLPAELLTQFVLHADDDTLWNLSLVNEHMRAYALPVIQRNYEQQIAQTYDDAITAYFATLPLAATLFANPPVYDPTTDKITRIIELDQVDRFRYLLSLGLDIRSYPQTGWTYLGLAIAFKANRILDFFVDVDAAVLFDEDFIGIAHVGVSAPTVLSLTAESANSYAFQRIVDRMHINFPGLFAELSGKGVYEMCANFPPNVVDRVCRAGLDLSIAQDPTSGESVWHAGVQNPDPEILHVLGEYAPEKINDVDVAGYSALFKVAESYNPTELPLTRARILLSYGIDVEVVTVSGMTAVHLANYYPKPCTLELTRLILNKSPLLVDGCQGMMYGTVLHALVTGLRNVLYEPGLPLVRCEHISDELEAKTRQEAVDTLTLIMDYNPDLEIWDFAGRTVPGLVATFGFDDLAAVIEGGRLTEVN